MSENFSDIIARVEAWAASPSDNLVMIHSIADDLKVLLADLNLAVDITAGAMVKPLNSAMPNDDAWRLGEICQAAAKDPNVGDYIDRGLILCRVLDGAGYCLVKKPRDWRAPAGR